jgi:hypothetical protein
MNPQELRPPPALTAAGTVARLGSAGPTRSPSPGQNLSCHRRELCLTARGQLTANGRSGNRRPRPAAGLTASRAVCVGRSAPREPGAVAASRGYGALPPRSPRGQAPTRALPTRPGLACCLTALASWRIAFTI